MGKLGLLTSRAVRGRRVDDIGVSSRTLAPGKGGTKRLAVLTLVSAMLCFAPAYGAAPTTGTVVSAEVTKVVTFVVENKSLEQMKAGMPYTYGLAQEYGHATNFKAITHPSLPNYLAIASGSTQGVEDNASPSSHKLEAPTVFARAIANGKTAKMYMDGMFSDRCRQSNYGKYVVRHNAWTYFPSERTLCERYDFDFKYFAGDVAEAKLGNISQVIAHNGNNAHDGSMQTADNWIKARMATLFAGPDWQSGKLAVVITADEDDGESGNIVLTTVIHPSQQANVVTTPLSHYSLSRFYSEVTGTTPLLNAADAPSMADAFGLDTPASQ